MCQVLLLLVIVSHDYFQVRHSISLQLARLAPAFTLLQTPWCTYTARCVHPYFRLLQHRRNPSPGYLEGESADITTVESGVSYIATATIMMIDNLMSAKQVGCQCLSTRHAGNQSRMQANKVPSLLRQ